MKTLFTNCKVVTNKVFEGNVVVDNGIIEYVGINKPEGNYTNIINCQNNYLFPGMIDIHLHGSYNYDFINGPLDIIGQNLPKEGTTSYLASLTIVSHQQTIELLKKYDKFKPNKTSANFLGVHLEGPYLSEAKKALMNPIYLRDADEKEIKELLSYKSLKVITIAPEINNCLNMIKKYHKQVNFMIGHTNCSCQQASQALENGAKGFTHLYNAMSQHTHRNPGAVTAALNSKAYCELIVDGNHVDKDVVKATYRTLGPKQIILITDAMLAKGMDDGDYIFSNLACRKEKDKVNVIETGIFAGSVITQNDAIKNMKKFTNCSICDLAKMASENPAKFLKVKKGKIKEGYDGDLILLDEQLNVKASFIKGNKVY